MNKILLSLIALNKLQFELALSQTFDIHRKYFSEKADKIKLEFLKKYKGNTEFEKIDKDDVTKIMELYSDESILAIAIFLKIYSTIEIYLDEYSRIFEKHSFFDLKINDLSGKGINRSKIYLEKIAKVKITKNNSEWEFLKCLGKIRNSLIHSGEFEKSLQKTVRKFFNESEVKFTDRSGIRLESGFLKKVKEHLVEIFNLNKVRNGV